MRSLKRESLKMSMLAIISAILTVGVICPLGCAVNPPEIILEQLGELKQLISGAVDVYPTLFSDTNTAEQANALYNKIDAVEMMIEEGNYKGAARKLEGDISPKLSYPPSYPYPPPYPYPAPYPYRRSWLSNDPELQLIVEEFAGTCQLMIEDILEGLTNFNG